MTGGNRERAQGVGPFVGGALLCMGLGLAAVARAEPVVDPVTCHAYEALDGVMTWEQARSAAGARAFGGAAGHLATITSGAESAFVAGAIGHRDSFAIGGIQVGGPEPAGGWTWITGEAWDFTNW